MGSETFGQASVLRDKFLSSCKRANDQLGTEQGSEPLSTDNSVQSGSAVCTLLQRDPQSIMWLLDRDEDGLVHEHEWHAAIEGTLGLHEAHLPYEDREAIWRLMDVHREGSDSREQLI